MEKVTAAMVLNVFREEEVVVVVKTAKANCEEQEEEQGDESATVHAETPFCSGDPHSSSSVFLDSSIGRHLTG